MEEKFRHIDDIIAKYLCNEANDDEITLLQEWRHLSKENEKEFSDMQTILQQMSGFKDRIQVDTNKAWKNVQKNIDVKQHPNTSKAKGKTLYFKLYRLAAVLTILAGLSVLMYRLLLKEPEAAVRIAAVTQTKKSNLPDGSTVVMKKGSSITYIQNTFQSRRTLELSGEAFFEVKHQDEAPFIISVGKLQIEDIGTSFNVKAIRSDNIVTVAVISGEVRMYDTKSSLNLKPGETAQYNVIDGTLSHVGGDMNEAAYATKHFVFNNTDLKEVVHLLNEAYNTNIIVADESLNSCRLTSSFQNENPDDILSIIAVALKLQVEKNDSVIYLKGEGCN
ncbi:MAG: FecR domain-containing protein [Bacteroidetes bacterium]|jgi:ferric-dicitrate binding protein FerR (iron transport regulator)|nr:FecR domain-containing protein [Bacteroidota bacterium]